MAKKLNEEQLEQLDQAYSYFKVGLEELGWLIEDMSNGEIKKKLDECYDEIEKYTQRIQNMIA